MSLVHIVVTKVTGYDLFTLYFDDRPIINSKKELAFLAYKEEFTQTENEVQTHPEYDYEIHYNGYFCFPEILADEIYKIYKSKCETKPSLKTRYNISFDKEFSNLEGMIKKFDQPMETTLKAKDKYKTYCHHIEYFERSIQILRDIQTAIYETDTEIAAMELDLHKRYLSSIIKV